MLSTFLGPTSKGCPIKPYISGCSAQAKTQDIVCGVCSSLPANASLLYLLPCISTMCWYHSTTLVYTNLTVAHHTHTHKGPIQSWGVSHTVCVWANYNHHIVRNNALHTAQWLCMYIYTVDHCTGVTACWMRKENLIVHVVCPPHLPLWTDWDLIQAALRLRWASNSLLHASTYRLHTHTHTHTHT